MFCVVLRQKSDGREFYYKRLRCFTNKTVCLVRAATLCTRLTASIFSKPSSLPLYVFPHRRRLGWRQNGQIGSQTEGLERRVELVGEHWPIQLLDPASFLLSKDATLVWWHFPLELIYPQPPESNQERNKVLSIWSSRALLSYALREMKPSSPQSAWVSCPPNITGTSGWLVRWCSSRGSVFLLAHRRFLSMQQL